MTFHEKMVVMLLLLVARMLEDDRTIQAEIKSIANKISLHKEKKPESE